MTNVDAQSIHVLTGYRFLSFETNNQKSSTTFSRLAVVRKGHGLEYNKCFYGSFKTNVLHIRYCVILICSHRRLLFRLELIHTLFESNHRLSFA